MSLDVASIVALTLCLCACTSAIPKEDFLGKGPTSLSLENDYHEIPLPSFGENFVELFRCRNLGRIRVFAAGRVTFLPSDPTAEVNNLELDVFTVDDTEINKTLSFLYYRTIVPDSGFATIIRDDFDQYFPRRSIDPDFAIVITWDLNNTTHTDLFQCIIVFDIDMESVFVIYQYADDNIQWPSADDDEAIFPSVRAEVCGGEDSDIYEIDDSGTSDIISRVRGKIIPGVDPKGRVAFLIARGTDPVKDETIDEIFEHIPCPNVCDLNHGDCKVANVCVCDAGYTLESNCTLPECTKPCDAIHGNCIAPNNCTCNTGYTNTESADCSILQCDAEEKCKHGGTCLADPSRLNECDCSTAALPWTGDTCEIPVCTQTCDNGGTCAAPNTCACVEDLWTGDNCTMPICDSTCLNGGTCVAPNTCVCPSGWSGDTCTDPVCDPTCGDHGTCMASNMCECTDDYTGERCETPPPPPTDPTDPTDPTTLSPSPDPSSTSTGTAPTEGSTGTQLSAGAIGGIVGGIVGFVILLMIMGIVIIGAFCAM